MNIAQIAPPWLTIPPNRYGGTENVIYHLVEELVSQGHNVTLFAPGDAKTSARHISFFPRSLSESGIPRPANLKAYYHLHKAVEQVSNGDFDIVHTHLSSTADMYIFPLMASLTIPHITTLHSHFPFDRAATSDWVGDADHYYMKWASKTPMSLLAKLRVSRHWRNFLSISPVWCIMEFPCMYTALYVCLVRISLYG